MDKFQTFTGVAAPMPAQNIDTDKVIPARFLKTIERKGLGKHLFNDMRYNGDGSENEDFILNKAASRGAEVLVVGNNFGCGSSREHAPWALNDYGVKCLIGTDFADIFFNNCFKNGVLPIVLSEDEVSEIFKLAESQPTLELTVDLETQKVSGGGIEYSFEIDPSRRHNLLNGLDDIAQTLQHEELINEYESNRSW